jgi:hypothetical protein
MTGEEIKELCRRKGVTFLRHHACGICGEYTGWFLFGRWPPFEVAYSSGCGCGFGVHAEPDTWESIAKWVCDENGELRADYKWLKVNEGITE